MKTSTSGPRSTGNASVYVMVLIVAILGIAGGVMLKDFLDQRRETADRAQMVANMVGMDAKKTVNTLDARYTDADGDLVPDGPKDVSKQLDPAVLTFSYVGVDDPAEFKVAFADLMKKLSAGTGKPVEYLAVSSTDEELAALRDGKLHIAGLGTGAVPVGVNLGGFVPVSTFGDDKGIATYHLVFIVRKDSAIQQLGDLSGRELTLTEPKSLSGFRAPLVLLRSMGLQAGRDFAVRYSQGHAQSIEGIKKGAFECAALTSDVLQREVAAGAVSPNDFRTIYTSKETYPSAAFGYSCNLKPELAIKITNILRDMDLKGTSMEPLFGNEGKSRLVVTDFKKDWERVRETDASLGVNYAIPPSEVPTTNTPASQP